MELGSNNKARMLIGGELVEAEAGGWIEAINPATEDVIGFIPDGQAADVDKAVAAAKAAQPEWAARSIPDRVATLRKMADKITERIDDIVNAEVQDNGKTIGAFRRMTSFYPKLIERDTALAAELRGSTVPASPGNLHYTVREPYGVVGVITPFNHAFGFAVMSATSPCVVGNTVVLKCPETCSLASLILGEICAEVLPAGVFNIVSGYGETAGDALVRHPDVKRIAFTGSAQTGRIIQKAAADSGVKHVSLELGGKNPLIVFPDADIDKAVDGAMRGMNFAWQSQSCGSTSRVLLHESVHDEFVAKLVDKVSAIRVGNPLDDASEMGAINSPQQYDKVMGLIASARDEGATLATGGKRPAGTEFARGYWVEPTVFTGVTQDMRIANEEVFGPVISILKWSDPEDMIAMANATQYGLTASIWTKDLDTAHKTAARVQSGYIWINDASDHYHGMPFGGYKASGVGRQEDGINELLSYTEEKAVNVILG